MADITNVQFTTNLTRAWHPNFLKYKLEILYIFRIVTRNFEL